MYEIRFLRAKANIKTQIDFQFVNIPQQPTMKDKDFKTNIWSHYKPLYGFAFKFTKNIEDAEDLIQETFVKAVRFQSQYQENTNLRSWLFTILRNTFINSYRAKVKKRNLIVEEEDLTRVEVTDSNKENRSESKFVIDDVKQALLKLPERYRLPFIMYFEGYKYEEIAERFSIPLGTVKTNIFCARKLLKEYLKSYEP